MAVITKIDSKEVCSNYGYYGETTTKSGNCSEKQDVQDCTGHFDSYDTVLSSVF